MGPSDSQVVVAFDFSHSARAALTRAVALAARAPWHVLQVVAVVDPHAPFPAVPARRVDPAYVARVNTALVTTIDEELADHDTSGDIRFDTHVASGKPAPEILRIAEQVGADLILVGCKGLTGLERFVVGSTAERIVREAGCTVEVVREKRYQTLPSRAASLRREPSRSAC